MYVLYIANKNYSSWSLRPWLLMRQLGIAFEERLVPFGEGDFRRFSPSGKVPCLVDGARTVWDSLAICEYLAERHDGVWPADEAARTWARCASAEMHSGFQELRSRCSMNLGIRVELSETPAALAEDIARAEALWEDGLRAFGGPYLAGGKFTAVDAFYAPVAYRFLTYGIPLHRPPAHYAERLRGLKPMREWYAAALKEPWREDRHEEAALASGRLTDDLRSR
ncbi:MAG TPA: glutathione S-transferase family protein [Rhodospirillales bacterium]|nr:glutathione S-transferase family protein [Rhodospirillales bacterium]